MLRRPVTSARRVREARNCLHQEAPLLWVLLDLMATGRASRWRGIRRRPQFRDQAQDVSE